MTTPDFIDHFPMTSPGHGRVPRYRKGGIGDHATHHPTKAKPCAQVTCEMNMRGGGESHQKGRAANAGAWMRVVAYNGPDPGISATAEREPRKVDVVHGPKHHCQRMCQEKGVHAVCLQDPPFRTALADQMAHRVGRLECRTKSQEAHILNRWMGVERAWRKGA